MVAVPIRPAYGPTLGRILSPRWRAASRLTRRVVIALVIGVLVVIVAAALTFVNAKFSHGGSVPFRFSYRGLYRVAPDPGGYVKVDRRRDGRLEDSFAVEPLLLPPYSGEQSGELPLYAARYIAQMKRRYAGFVLRGEGKTKVSKIPGYDVFYSRTDEGQTVFGRDVLVLPQRRGAREGVDIVMLTSPTANAQVTSPVEVATTGILLRPLKTFSFG
jgi:hypothetical protein